MAPYDGRLLVDESHSFGVLGEAGRGAVEHHGVYGTCALVGGSTSKGLGVVGGIIPADDEIVARCRATPASRSASAGLPAAAAMCAASLQYVREHPELRMRLRANVAYMKSGLRKLGIDVADTVAPVASFVAGADRPMHTLQEQLMARGIYVLHSNYIGVSAAGAIRCGIFADHSTEHMDRLFDALRTLL
jgi:glycine C-acetyltransferase/8-amino-7-oxononanoate synthase